MEKLLDIDTLRWFLDCLDKPKQSTMSLLPEDIQGRIKAQELLIECAENALKHVQSKLIADNIERQNLVGNLAFFLHTCETIRAQLFGIIPDRYKKPEYLNGFATQNQEILDRLKGMIAGQSSPVVKTALSEILEAYKNKAHNHLKDFTVITPKTYGPITLGHRETLDRIRDKALSEAARKNEESKKAAETQRLVKSEALYSEAKALKEFANLIQQTIDLTPESK